MNAKLNIRAETADDTDAITEVTVAAFKALEISNQTEQFIIEALRAAGALTVSLVAERGGRVGRHHSTAGLVADQWRLGAILLRRSNICGAMNCPTDSEGGMTEVADGADARIADIESHDNLPEL